MQPRSKRHPRFDDDRFDAFGRRKLAPWRANGNARRNLGRLEISLPAVFPRVIRKRFDLRRRRDAVLSSELFDGRTNFRGLDSLIGVEIALERFRIGGEIFTVERRRILLVYRRRTVGVERCANLLFEQIAFKMFVIGEWIQDRKANPRFVVHGGHSFLNKMS